MFHLTVRYRNQKLTHEVVASQPTRLVSDLLRELQLPLNTRCGGRGLCDGCMIDLLSGQLLHQPTAEVIRADDAHLRVRGCECALPATGSADIRLPVRSLLAHRPQIVASFRMNVARAHDPLWQTARIEPGEWNQRPPSSETLCQILAERDDRALPVVAEEAFHAEILTGNEAICLELAYQGSHWRASQLRVAKPGCGLAIDIGTTTVVVMVVNLETGDVLASFSALNTQTHLGDNVLTRINKCMADESMTQRLQHALVQETLGPLIGQAIRAADVPVDQIRCAVVAGNTTMLHLLLGENPASMGVAPFTPGFLDYRPVDSRQLALNEPGRDGQDGEAAHAAAESSETSPALQAWPCVGTIHLLPGAAAYVGADITAGVLASGMAYRDDSCLLVDLGTNGEIVLRHQNVLLGCATAAGPAFEGAGLTCGVRAGKGAISHIWLEPGSFQVTTEVIDRAAPTGICGTAYVDFVARAHGVGLISATGRFTPRAHDGHLEEHGLYGWGMNIGRTRNGESIFISEADMASLLQAKAAIAAGIACLLRRLDLQPAQVSKVYVAGGFGFHMHVDSLLGCGLLPDFVPEQIELVGNTALAGAYLTLLDSGAMNEIQRLSKRIEIVELNLDPAFEMTYIDHLSLPPPADGENRGSAHPEL